MKFAGINGMIGASLANTMTARLAHTKTMSLVCFANMIAFGMLMTQNIMTSVYVAKEDAMSAKIGMDENMNLMNIAIMFGLCTVSYCGWVETGSEKLVTLPTWSSLSDLETFNYVHCGIGLLFGVPAVFMPAMLLDNYLPGNVWNGTEEIMCMELMKFMGMLLIGSAIRGICIIQGGDENAPYSHTRANVLWYAMILGFMVFADTNATKVFCMNMDDVMPAKVFDFVRNFGMFYWGTQTLIKND